MFERIHESLVDSLSRVNSWIRGEEEPINLMAERDDLHPDLEQLEPQSRQAAIAEMQESGISNIDTLKGYSSIVFTKENLPYLVASSFSQNSNLFNATVRDNILYGSPVSDSVSDEDILALAARVKLDKFIAELPSGLDTEVGEGGKALSGGQQQKVAILRGLMKQTDIILLDEITASLDSQSANDITMAMNEISNGKTTLIITYKLSEVRHLDSIAVIDEGRVIAQGVHEELLTHCELYQRLWQNYSNSASGSTTKMMKQLGESLREESESLLCESGPSGYSSSKEMLDQQIQHEESKKSKAISPSPKK